MTLASSTVSRRRAIEGGFTLVELMVGLTLGLIVLGVMTSVFVSTSSTRREMERSGRQIENGRYALELLDDDLVVAGYFGEFDVRTVDAPTVKPDPCATDVDALKAAVPMHVQGYEADGAKPACLSDVRDGTDVVVVRRASTCVAGTPNCDAPTAGESYIQSSLCNVELANPVVSTRYAVAALPSSGASPFTLTRRDCATPAVLRRYVAHIYFVANNNNAGDNIPTLKRAELAGGAFNIVPLVEGVENLQMEYGVDTTGDGRPDTFTVDPGKLGGCAADACYVANWMNTMTATARVLTRTTEPSFGHNDTKTFAMGMAADDATPLVVGPFNDGFRRHAYMQTVRLNNPAGRRE
jgi:type IV pilus assembly protein PilW